MLKIRNMRVEDVETVARMVALDHNDDPEKGYIDARGHTLNHLKIVPLHCYVVENGEKTSHCSHGSASTGEGF